MPRSRIVRSARSRRPNNSWSGVVISAFSVIAANSKVLLSSLVLSNQGIDETIMRVVGSITVISDQAAAAEQQIGGVGLMIVTDLALAAGAASIPGPSTDVEDDAWFAHALFQHQDKETTSPRSLTTNFSSKGRRVVESGQSIALMVENSHATHGFSIGVQFRMLSRVTGT